MTEIFYTESPTIVKKIVFIEGVSRTGKLFLGKLVSGLKKVEYMQAVTIIEKLPLIERLGGITEDAAIALIRSIIGEAAYNMVLGRYLNLRYDDATCIYNSIEFDGYIRRSLTQERNVLLQSFYKENSSPLFVLHETLPNVKILFKAFQELRMISLQRNPVDVIHSWYSRGWGHRFGTDPTSVEPVIKGTNGPVPWFASEWKEEYEESSEVDRIIKSVAILMELGGSAYQSLSDDCKKQILFVRYEDVVEKTNDVISSICSFLGTEPSDYMPQILIRERCNRKLPLQNREKKKQELLDKASKNYANLLLKLTDDYEKRSLFA